MFSLHYGNENNLFILAKMSIRQVLGSYFNLQRRVCAIMKEMVAELIDSFRQTSYISDFLTHEHEFNSFINASIQNFKLLAPVTIVNLLELVRDTTQGNQLLTGPFNNAMLEYNMSSATQDGKISILWVNPLKESCNCGISTDFCQVSYNDYCNNSFSYIGVDTCSIPVPGLYITCHLMSGMSHLSLACYYNIECATLM